MLRSIFRTTEDRLFFGVLLTLLAVSAALALAYDFVPLLDWPEHLADASITQHFSNPRWAVGRYYDQPAWFQPYHVFRWMQAGLGTLFGMAGLRAALLVQLWGLPLVALALARQLGHDRWSALAAFTVVVEANLLWGFLPYVAGTVFMLVGVAVLNGWLQEPKDWKLFTLSAISVLVFFTHPVPLLLLCLTCAVLAVVAAVRRRLQIVGVFAVAGALLPGFALLLIFLFSKGWLGEPKGQSIPLPSWAGLKWSVSQVGPQTGLTLVGSTPAWCFLLAAVALAVGAALELLAPSKEGRRGCRVTGPVLFVLWAGLCVLLPAWWKGESMGSRVFSLAAFGGLLAIPFTGARSPARWPVRALVVVAAFASLLSAHAFFRRYDRDNQPLRHAIKLIPYGARVATLPYTYAPEGYALPTYIHLSGYVTAARGGYSSFTFTHVPYKPAFERFGLGRSIWQIANHFAMADELTDFYDYILVRKGARYDGVPFKPRAAGKKTPRRIFAEGEYELWETLN
jgi:hypothetical protein